jgi:hypothetical protein
MTRVRALRDRIEEAVRDLAEAGPERMSNRRVAVRHPLRGPRSLQTDHGSTPGIFHAEGQGSFASSPERAERPFENSGVGLL